MSVETIMDDFEYADRDAVLTKLAAFSLQGAYKTHLLLDFDRTLTVGIQDDDDATTWAILQNHLPTEGQARYLQAYQHYRPREIASEMTEALAREWTGGILDLFAEYRVHLPSIEQDFMSSVTMRPGAAALLAASAERGMPSVILSAGIKDIIDILMRRSGVQADLTLSTELILDSDGRITGWNPDTLVHTHNKHEAAHADLLRIRSEHPQCILVGDAMSDTTMAAGDDTVLRIRILDPRKGDHKDPATIRAETFEKFDLAISSGMLNPVSRLVMAL